MIGPTGSGKTTLLNLIAGLLKPDQGSIIIDGLDITNKPIESRRLGYTFQSPSLFPHLNVYENIVFGLDKRNKKENNIQIMNFLKDLGISHLINRRIQGLSGGEMQKVSLARMLITKPKAMLMDEPLAHLDNPTKRRLRLDLRRVLKIQRVPVIYVTHFEDDVYALADSVSTLHNGVIEYTDKLESIFLNSSFSSSSSSYSSSSSSFLSNGFTGGNYLEGEVVRSNAGVTIFSIGSHLLETLGSYRVGSKVGIVLRPEDIILSKENVNTSARNIVRAKVISITKQHNESGIADIHLLIDKFRITARITEESRTALGIREDDFIFAIFKASSPQVVREE
jgi:molybdate transport system ATP-binding protein